MTANPKRGPAYDILAERNRLALQPPHAVLRWAWATYGARVAVTSSFQTQSLPLLHIIAADAPGVPVLFLDTGFHFPETLAFRDQVVAALGLNLEVVRPDMDRLHFDLLHGELYSRDPDRCCYLNKVRPLEVAMQRFDAWIAGIRRDQTAVREAAHVLDLDAHGKVRIAPLLSWTHADVRRYISHNELPEHPLGARGYPSVGCAPCTQPARGADPRAGRWAGANKTECGIHLLTPRDQVGSV